ncbi:hypothetical protein [Hasllibacter sp. MH4015]|uniref:hypothetical protein n=1 Tax=Hasllibacter sp. MH4015 TaxID=2854029 RepID=UPI001CD502AB|nr:hypothetical protein [Hasllibacter sp. MH4015]
MKKSLSLLALMAATTFAAPLAAQDMSDFLNPSALAAQLGLTSGNHGAIAAVPRNTLRLPNGYAVGQAPRVIVHGDVEIARLDPVIPSLAPRVSVVPVPRALSAVTPLNAVPETTGVAPRIAAELAPMEEVLDDVARAAPAGANTAIISTEAGTVVAHGQGTTTSARPTLWQRIFGL